MSGFLFFGFIFLLGYGALLLARWATRKIHQPWLRKGATILLVPLLMSLLVADEIIGGFQFRALCRENAVLKIDAAKAKGRTVRVFFDPLNEILPSTAVTIYHSHKSYRDVATNNEIASNEWYFVKAGWFIRTLGISEKNAPLTIAPSYCYPSLTPSELAASYGITLIK